MTRQEKRSLNDLKYAQHPKQAGPAGPRPPQPPRKRVGARAGDWDEIDDSAAKPARRGNQKITPTIAGLVTAIGAGTVQVRVQDKQLGCLPFDGVAVGDRVLIAGKRISTILPRSSVLSRPDPHNPHRERILAANVDIVAIVVSVHNPDLRPGLIDRYLIACERGGVESVVCVNKMDLAAGPPAALEPYHELGLRIFHCSAATGEGVPELSAALAGKMCVFSGHSGVGKSSLLNAIEPGLGLRTKTVSEATQKGRHSTTGSALYELHCGATIIDTPGIREFGLSMLSPEEVRRYFHEFDQYAPGCAFSDCSHQHEPECAVRRAAELGEIAAARYAAYRRLISATAMLDSR